MPWGRDRGARASSGPRHGSVKLLMLPSYISHALPTWPCASSTPPSPPSPPSTAACIDNRSAHGASSTKDHTIWTRNHSPPTHLSWPTASPTHGKCTRVGPSPGHDDGVSGWPRPSAMGKMGDAGAAVCFMQSNSHDGDGEPAVLYSLLTPSDRLARSFLLELLAAALDRLPALRHWPERPLPHSESSAAGFHLFPPPSEAHFPRACCLPI